MSTSHFFLIVLEILISGILIIGFFYEPLLARWERKQARKVLRALKKMKEFRK